MAVAVDVVGTEIAVAPTSPVSNSTSITVGASATALLVAVNFDDATVTVSSLKWNGVALTKIGEVVTSDNFCITQLWGLVNPAAGAKALVCTFSGGAPGAIDMQATSFTGTQTSSVAACFTNFTSQANNTAGSTNSVTITSATGNHTYACGNSNNASTYSINQTQVYTNTGASFQISAASRASGAATVTFTGTLTGLTATNCICGCNIAASAGAATYGYLKPKFRPLLRR